MSEASDIASGADWDPTARNLKSRPMRYRWRYVGEQDWREGEGTIIEPRSGLVRFYIPKHERAIQIDCFMEDIRES